MLSDRELRENVANLIGPNLANPENVRIRGNVRYNPSAVLKSEDHSGACVSVGRVNYDWANGIARAEIVGNIATDAGIEGRAIAFAVWAKIVVEADEDAGRQVVSEPRVDIGSVVEGDDAELRVTLGEDRSHRV
jgi:hypothetical protein